MDKPPPNADAPGAQPSQADSAFAMLHPGVQHQLWRMGWKGLRPLQVEAIHAILGGDRHVILSAATASGKTEAAFLPILSRIAPEPTGSVRAMYVGPLKALINDQFARVEDLCTHLDVPVFHWHGDVAASEKARLVERPGGVLLITPESLESLFVNRSQYLPALFGGLRFVIIDELHSFMDNERGLHLRSLLSRVRQLMAELPEARPYRVAALSATIGDAALARRFVDADRPDDVLVLTDAAGQKEIKYRVHGYHMALQAAADEEDDADAADPAGATDATDATADDVPAGGAGADGQEPAPQAPGDEQGDPPQEDPLLPVLRRMAGDIVRHCAGHSNLVFANSKADVEVFADLAQRIAHEQRLGDTFLVHHGSLSALLRQDTEQAMKSGQAATAFCSSTLEMGIDIGSVRMVGQVGPSWSVASQLQRMGRSGRKEGEPRIMRVYIDCGEVGPKAGIFDRLHLPLVQAVAVSQLMLAGWLEPPRPPCCDLSTLTQQILSLIAETGGLRAEALHERLCRGGAFRDVEPPLLARLLRRLGEQDVIEQMPGGDLILGLRGERLRKDKGFYACFATEEEFTVIHGEQTLGTVQAVPRPRDPLLFAGRRWLVADVDADRREIHVTPARGWQRPRFSGGPGLVHAEIRRAMRDVLAAAETYAYLDREASDLLAAARQSAAEARVCAEPLVALSPSRSALMTWTGTGVQETLAAMFRCQGLDCDDEGIALTFKTPLHALRQAVADLQARTWDGRELARRAFPRQRRKYDWLLDDELLDVCLSRGALDCDGATDLLRRISGASGPAPATEPRE